MCDTLTNLVRRKEWVSCLVLICFTFLCNRFCALPARSLPVVNGKPHKATTYTFSSRKLCSILVLLPYFAWELTTKRLTLIREVHPFIDSLLLVYRLDVCTVDSLRCGFFELSLLELIFFEIDRPGWKLVLEGRLGLRISASVLAIVLWLEDSVPSRLA